MARDQVSESTKGETAATDTLTRIFGRKKAIFGTVDQALTNHDLSEFYYVVPELYDEAIRLVADTFPGKAGWYKSAILKHFVEHQRIRAIAKDLHLSHATITPKINQATGLIRHKYLDLFRSDVRNRVPLDRLNQLVTNVRADNPGITVDELSERVTTAVNDVRDKLTRGSQEERPQSDEVLQGGTYAELEEAGVPRRTAFELVKPGRESGPGRSTA